jgi:hypothetical protein
MPRRKSDKQRSDEITKRLRGALRPNVQLIEDAVCEDGQTSIPPHEEDDEGSGIDYDLVPPTLTVVSETVRCKDKRDWVNITVSYDAADDFEYEFEIIEADL